MKVLITGGKGMLGRTLQKCWQDWELVIADLPEADICDPAGFDRIIAESKPDAVVNRKKAAFGSLSLSWRQ